MNGFVLLGDFQEIFNGSGFEDFLVFLEVMESHFDSGGDFGEGFLFEVEADGVVMIAFSFGFHLDSIRKDEINKILIKVKLKLK